MNLISIVLMFAVSTQHSLPTEAILCYQCSDSTDTKGLAACKNEIYSLSLQRADFENRNLPFKRYSSLKNCSHYLNQYDEPSFAYCKIEEVSSYGRVTAYIRDCSNGKDFSADLNVTRLSMATGFLKADNQTTCGYSQTHLANICIKLCATDFCNGPTAGTNCFISSHFIIVIAYTLAQFSLMKILI